MRIVHSTKSDYAHVEWEREKKDQLRTPPSTLICSSEETKPLKGLRIEISKDDLVPQDVRKTLKEGRFFLVEG